MTRGQAESLPQESTIVQIFTDGACRGNPGPGGWAALLKYRGKTKTISGGESHTTNNRMELMAAIRALESLKRSCNVQITTDSLYLMKGITEWLPKWKKKNWRTASNSPVKNVELWQRLEAASHKHTIEWCWTRGHDGHEENELVDKLAGSEIDKILKHY